ncbi:MAG TPA: hypothetical protein VG432_12935 [Gemmatimonadaceae bacterium]|nr:hypothetical protein [Gemmatimonadaceae bacterium]
MIFTTPEALARLVDPWSKFYSHSKTTETIVTFLHIAPIVIGGGIAIALDRASLRLRHEEPGARERHLAELGSVHPIVITALVVSLVSGIALLAADLDTFLGSWVFWVKMALVAALLANGALMTRLERALAAPGSGTSEQWRRLRRNAITSLALWLTITLAGVILTNV